MMAQAIHWVPLRQTNSEHEVAAFDGSTVVRRGSGSTQGLKLA